MQRQCREVVPPSTQLTTQGGLAASPTCEQLAGGEAQAAQGGDARPPLFRGHCRVNVEAIRQHLGALASHETCCLLRSQAYLNQQGEVTVGRHQKQLGAAQRRGRNLRLRHALGLQEAHHCARVLLHCIQKIRAASCQL